jgi:DNA-binding NarL/FixJ family response regulator
MTISVLVADDHPMFRDGLSAMLDTQPDIQVVAQVGTGHAAITAATERRPNVAILDLRMPDGDGIGAAIGIRQASPDTRILVLTTFDGPDEVGAALAAGAHGYLIKSAAPGEIAQAVRAVAAGNAVLDDDILTRLAQGTASHGRQLFPELTHRETAVLAALARGLSTEAAGTALGLTPKTVRNYLASITAKLGVRDRTAAILVARDRGLDTPPSST